MVPCRLLTTKLTFQMTFKVWWVNRLLPLSILKYLNTLGSQRLSFFPAGEQCFEAQIKATKERDGLSGVEMFKKFSTGNDSAGFVKFEHYSFFIFLFLFTYLFIFLRLDLTKRCGKLHVKNSHGAS